MIYLPYTKGKKNQGRQGILSFAPFRSSEKASSSGLIMVRRLSLDGNVRVNVLWNSMHTLDEFMVHSISPIPRLRNQQVGHRR